MTVNHANNKNRKDNLFSNKKTKRQKDKKTKRQIDKITEWQKDIFYSTKKTIFIRQKQKQKMNSEIVNVAVRHKFFSVCHFFGEKK